MKRKDHLSIGNVVVRMGGDGSMMTVAKFESPNSPWVQCQWFEGAELKSDWYRVDELLVMA